MRHSVMFHFVILFVLLFCVGTPASGENKDNPFGFHTGNAFPEDIKAHNPGNLKDPAIWGNYQYAQDIGVGWERPALYASIPPADSGWTWPQLTDAIYATIPNSMNILTNIDVRSFAYSRAPEIPEEVRNITTYYPRISSLKLIDEKRYVQFVRDLVERYDGDGLRDMPGLKNPVKYWQIDNELPGIPPQGLNSLPTDPVNERWLNNTIKNYARVLRISSEAIKSADPQAKVVIAGMADMGPATPAVFYKFYGGVLKQLRGRYVDIFDYHFYANVHAGDGIQGWRVVKDAYAMVRQGLDSMGFQNMEVWITETGTYSGRPRDMKGDLPVQTEREQAADLVKRMIYPLTFGVKKVFWAWGIVDCAVSEGPDGHTGLIYDGRDPYTPSYGVKKLAYYSFKKLVDTLQGSDWNHIQVIQENEGVYLYKFTRGSQPVWVAWNENNTPVEVTLSGIDKDKIIVTKVVPSDETGRHIQDYPTAFDIQEADVTDGRATLFLDDSPALIEEQVL